MADADYLTVPYLNTKKLKSIFSRIRIDKDSGCWIWTGCQNSYGYGVVRFQSRPVGTHRLMYAWLVEPIPRGLKVKTIDHIVCNTPLCCNPIHLALVTNRENVLRSNAPPAVYARSTHCKQGHPLTVVKGRRRCMECFKVSQKAGIARRHTAPNKAEHLEKDKMIKRRLFNGPDRAERLAAKRDYYHSTKVLKRPAKHKDSETARALSETPHLDQGSK